MVGPRSLSVIVPAYNEVGNLEGVIRDVTAAAWAFDDFEILVIDDGSTDGTGDLAERLAAANQHVRVLRHPRNRGFAAAYQTGLAHARLAYVTFVPGDHEVTLGSIESIFGAVGSADLVIPYHGTPWNRARHRRVLTWICTTQINLLFGHRLKYYQGPTVYPTALARSLPITAHGFFFVTEMLLQALALGCSWVEVPLTHRERAYGQSKAVKLSNIVNAEQTILRTWWALRVRGRPVALPARRDNAQPLLDP